ncbi:MAG: SpoIIE family protein phosphatase [bacterium]|nr:SpoIIE family protein phosphatase [bacterium]
MKKLFVILFFFTTTAGYTKSVVVDDTLKHLEITSKTEYYEDSQNRLTLDIILEKQPEWQSSKKNSFNFGFTNSTYWFRFSIDWKTKKKDSIYLEIPYPMIDHITLFEVHSNGSITKTETGDHLPFSTRDVIDRNFVFLLEKNPGSTYYLYCSTTSSLNFAPSLWSQKEFIKRANTELPLFWFYYGLMGVMVIYTFFVFLSIRERSYIYYSLFITSWILFQFTLNGFAFQYLWPNSIWWGNNCLPMFMSSCVLFNALFVRWYLETFKNFPITDKIIKYAIVTPAIIIILFSFSGYYLLSIKIATCFALYGGGTAYVTGFIALFHRSRHGFFIVASFVIFIIGVTLYVLKTFGLLPANPLTNWSIQIGSSFVVILLSFALADKINTMKKQLLDLNINLEKKVRGRTIELKEARDELWGEMQLAKKIQTVLLPEKPVLEGYEISSAMFPADEVGGDYYDIINAGGKDWFVIGDVSGHGVPAGLIMMMVKISIETTLENHPLLLPSELLATVNRIITKNIKKLDEVNYMTITVFAVKESGQLFFSGLHQDLMIFRHKTQTVERVETRGLWIGIVDEIMTHLYDDKLSLELNDVLLVYTDGITEAWEKGSKQNKRSPMVDMFGKDKLEKIFAGLGNKPVDSIKNEILAALKNYISKDDVTLVVLKRIS